MQAYEELTTMVYKEASEVLQISANTVIRDWNFAVAWLRRKMKGTGDNKT
jgi:hypothetical protein